MSTIESRTLNSTFYGFIQLALTFIHSILLVPILISNWGVEKYGMYLNIFAFIQLLRTLDLGHQVFVGNEFNREYHGHKERATSILTSSILMAFILGFAELVIFIILWVFGKANSFLGIPPSGSTPILIGILCMVFMWWMIGSVSGIFVKVVLSKGLYARTILWAILLKVLEIILLIFAGFSNLSLFHLLWMWAVINLVYSVSVLRWAWNQMKDLGINRKYSNWKQAFKTFRNSTVITINYLLEQFSTSGVNFIITRYLSLVLLPVYTTIRTLTNTAVQLTGLISNPLQPELIRYHSEKSGEKINSVIKTYWVVNGFLVNTAFVVILPFIDWLYGVWTKQLLTFDPKLFYMLCLSVSIFNFGRTLTTYLNGINDLTAITWMSSARCFIIIGISYCFIGIYGMMVIGIAVFIAEVISSVVIPVYRTKKIMRMMDSDLMWKDMMLAFIPFFILTFCFIGILWLHINRWVVSLAGIGLMIFIYSVAWNRLEAGVQIRLITLAMRYARINR